MIGMLPENKVSIEEMEEILNELFSKDKNILLTLSSTDRSNLKKLIRIYDYIKYKTP